MTRSVEPLLGTRGEVEVRVEPATDAARLQDARLQDARFEDAIVSEVERLEKIFTVFDPSSALCRFRATGSTDVPELLDVLALAEQWVERSGGAFAPHANSLITLWDAAEHNGALPTDADLAEAAAGLGDARIDNLNAIAKGWIAERAVQTVLTSAGNVESAWLSLGGDIVHRGREPMRVGIEDPARPYDNAAPLATVLVQGEALATSGSARRYWTIEGTRYAKVLDPRTGQPVDHVASATVIAPSAADADVLATVGLVMEAPEFFDLLPAGSAALLVLRDGSVRQSSDRFELRPSRAT